MSEVGTETSSKDLTALAEDYFCLLARAMPVCCLSDEFHHMPRAEQASVSRSCRTVGSMPVATAGCEDITGATLCRSNRMMQCEPKPYPAIAAILRGNHALLF